MSVVRSELQLKARVFNTPTPGASDNILPKDVHSLTYSSMLSVYCCFTASGKLTVTRRIGDVTTEEILNSNNSLVANCAYSFSVASQSDSYINFKYSAGSGNTNIFVVDEIT